MTATFYGVLGVGPDATDERIREAYRERVRTVHPDVNDDPNACEQFRRLECAKETLLDERERARYDRLGHVSYVRHHVSCPAWAGAVGAGHDGAAATSPSASESDSRDPQHDSTTRQDDQPTDGVAGNSSQATADATTDSTPPRESTARTPRPGSDTVDERQTSVRDEDDTSAATTSRNDTASRSSKTAPSRSSKTARVPPADAGGAYATSFWGAQAPGERVCGTHRQSASLVLRVLDGLRSLSPWALVRLVFIAAVAGTGWYIYAILLQDGRAPVPLLLILVGEVGLAVVLSTLPWSLDLPADGSKARLVGRFDGSN